MSDLKLRKLPHPSYEAFLGTETISPCDCKGCQKAYLARNRARGSFTYYEKPRAFKRSTPADRKSAEDRASLAKYAREHRAKSQ